MKGGDQFYKYYNKKKPKPLPGMEIFNKGDDRT